METITLAQELIRCPTITPQEGGALQFLQTQLTQLGFTCTRLDHRDVSNLHARIGTEGPHLGFAGHTDVVPLGNEKAWTVPPFGALIKEDKLWGRGAADMKCAIACFISAVYSFLKTEHLHGSISLIITGDEEGPALFGTRHMLDWIGAQNHTPDLCLIGEPASAESPGDQIKIGRRGSLTGTLTCRGKQGHIAYPHLADNPIPRLLNTLTALNNLLLDQGTEHFQPSNLEITSVDVNNQASNVIPDQGIARFGVRYNTLHEGENLAKQISEICTKHAGNHQLDIQVHGNAFLNENPEGIQIVSHAIERATGIKPILSTRGGTSDGRFLIKHCPVIEIGMTEKTMHQIDEHVPLCHIDKLTTVYSEILKAFFKN